VANPPLSPAGAGRGTITAIGNPAGNGASSTAVLLVGVAVLAVRVISAPLEPSASEAVSDLTQIASAALACLAVVLGLRAATGVHRHYGLRVLAGLAMALLLGIAEAAEPVLAVNEWLLLAVFAGAILLTMYQLSPLVIAGVARAMFVAAWLDMLIFFASGLVMFAAIAEWQQSSVSDASIAVVTCLIAMLAWAATSATVLFGRGVRLWLGGPFVMFGGLALVAVAGASWISSGDIELDVTWPTDVAFAVGVLLIARGWLTWTLEPIQRRGAWVAEIGRDMASMTAITVAILFALLGPHADNRLDVLGEIALVFGLLVAGVRQVAMKEFERRARLAEAATSALLATEILDRGRVAQALEGVEPAADAETTAQRICERMLLLPGAAFVLLTVLDTTGGSVVVAVAGNAADGLKGLPLDAPVTNRLRELAAGGAWSEPAPSWLAPSVATDQLGLVPLVAHSPLVWDEQLVGILTLGPSTVGPEETSRTTAAAREAGVIAAALVGPALANEKALRRRRDEIDRVIASHAFHPVYQPIVDLATGRIVGFEALTRFDDGGRPDRWFEEAASVGRGTELEVATLSAAVGGARELPAGCYLSLNLSADIASSVDVLGGVLVRIPRPVLLEITEQVPVEDYGRMMGSLYALDIQIRLAVDDAGAGYAGLQHILAIRPHVVKLDAALIRSVDTDIARQAIVEAMVSFAARTGCTIVGEGVETASEVAMIQSLGVHLAQGYFFGRPAPAAAWRHLTPKATPSGRVATAMPPGAIVPSC
jgi:EAL domain-containing protein (putative c-di-GMP-specific phosphodiesterase class I)